jgi:hypothetical protein
MSNQLKKLITSFKCNDYLNTNSSICLDPIIKDSNIILLPCGHYFMKTCIDEWFFNKV